MFSVIWCLALIWRFLNHYYFKYFLFSLLFLLLLLFPLHICYIFYSCPKFLNMLFIFFFSLCSLCFSLLETLLEILSSVVSGLLLNLSKSFFTSVIMWLISGISFWFFLWISFSLHCPSVLACCLLYSLEPLLSILIIITLNSWSVNSTSLPHLVAVYCIFSNYVYFILAFLTNFFDSWTQDTG